jgi:hypothetical protein
MESNAQEQHFPNKHISPRNYYRTNKGHLTYIMHKLYNGLITYSILLCLTKQDKHFIFLIHFLSKLQRSNQLSYRVDLDSSS